MIKLATLILFALSFSANAGDFSKGWVSYYSPADTGFKTSSINDLARVMGGNGSGGVGATISGIKSPIFVDEGVPYVFAKPSKNGGVKLNFGFKTKDTWAVSKEMWLQDSDVNTKGLILDSLILNEWIPLD